MHAKIMEIEFALLRSNTNSFVSLIPCELIKYIIELCHGQTDCAIKFLEQLTHKYDGCIHHFFSVWDNMQIVGEFEAPSDFAKRHLASNDGIKKFIDILDNKEYTVSNKIE